MVPKSQLVSQSSELESAQNKIVSQMTEIKDLTSVVDKVVSERN